MHDLTSPRCLVGAFLVFALTACEEKRVSPEAETATAKAQASSAEAHDHAHADETSQGHAHAPAGVKPGSYEDWCGEHQVPESQCTRCNPSLIAAFKATGDWCDQHGLPESQCLECNPDLKFERPPKKEPSP